MVQHSVFLVLQATSPIQLVPVYVCLVLWENIVSKAQLSARLVPLETFPILLVVLSAPRVLWELFLQKVPVLVNCVLLVPLATKLG
jgi:hypothetical protein